MKNNNEDRTCLTMTQLSRDVLLYIILVGFEIFLVLDYINSQKLTSIMILGFIISVLSALISTVTIRDVIKYRNDLNIAKLLINVNIITGVTYLMTSVVFVVFIVVKLFA